MAFEDIQARIALLVEQILNEPKDALELQELLREELNQIRGTGMPLPEDLLELERKLEAGQLLGK